MIFDSIHNLKKYAGTIPCTEQIEHYLNRLGGKIPENGVTELLGEDLYVSVAEAATAPKAERRWESHQKYADLQLLYEGTETFGTVVCAEQPEPTEAAPERDVWFYDAGLEESGMITLNPGEFIYFAPGELHKPCCAKANPGKIRKAVFKIRC